MNRTLESPEIQWRMDLERRAADVEEAARARRFVQHVRRSQREEPEKPKEWTRTNYWNIALSLAVVVLLLIALWTDH